MAPRTRRKGRRRRYRIETPGCESARCEVSNDKGRWTVESTPGTVTVATSTKPLEVSCNMQGTGSPLGPTRVPSAKGESGASATIAGGVAGAALGIAAIAAAAAVPWALPGAIQLFIPAVTVGAGVGGMVDEASRPVSYPATISVPLVCHVAGRARLAACRSPDRDGGAGPDRERSRSRGTRRTGGSDRDAHGTGKPCRKERRASGRRRPAAATTPRSRAPPSSRRWSAARRPGSR